MLKFLHIENIAVIESSDIEFSKGFNVLTGETGAGKSIVIDSLNAVLGERTSKDLIRAGRDSAEVSALFGDLSEDVLLKLKEFDILPDDDGNILITRKLSLSGKGIVKINLKPATATILKEISPFLINIHGQHDNQDLLNPEKHCGFIDAVAENDTEIANYYDEFRNLNTIRKELNSLLTDEDEKQHKIDILKYQIDELKNANIRIGELDELKANLKIAENFEEISKTTALLEKTLSGDEDNDGVLTLLKNALKQVSKVEDTAFSSIFSKLNEIISSAEDLSYEVSALSFGDDYSELNVDKINDRLDSLHKLMLKYGGSEQEMLEFLSDAENKLEAITFSDRRRNELEVLLEKSKEQLINLAKVVTNSRKKAAANFEKQVCEVLNYLNMPNVKFVVGITSGRYTKSGCDVVEFAISANAGEKVKSLHKIASGGELSRIMLAIKSSLLDKDNIPTMIFDEIDTGISGFAAEKVGNQLKKVSNNRQVLCVTHLAQIAAKADNHLLIEKTVKNGRTFTNVSPLSYEGRIGEIARIMSGSEVTENLYNSAKELLQRS